MSICRIENRARGAWCLDCQRYHFGHTLKLALDPSAKGESYRRKWRGLPVSKIGDEMLPYTAGQVIASYLKTVAKHQANGRLMVPDDVYFRRRLECNQCVHRDAEKDACKICKCNLSPSDLEATLIGNKLKWAAAECPAKKWHEWPHTAIDGTAEGKHGVVIGSYGMPGVVELSIAMIRKTCGDVPILIADDCTPESMGRQRLLDMPKKWPGVSLIMNGENLGHAPGDIRAYRNGLRWAEKNGISYICKLSQRFIFLSDRWLQDVCDEMEIHGYATSSQRAVHLHMQFAIRSECVFMGVKQCIESDGLMARLDPPGGKINASAEDWLHAGISEGRLMPVMRCRLMPVDRFGKHTSVLWHNSDSSDDYHERENKYTRLATEMGIDLGPEFSGAGWHVITAHRPDAGYHML